MSYPKNFSWSFLAMILTIALILGFSSPVLCQFSVTSMVPADGATSVDTLVTIEINFSAALDTAARFPVPGDFFLDLLIPEDSLLSPPDSVSLSADLKTVRLHNIRLFPDTKYLFGVLAAKSQAGDSLDQPAVVTFTTGTTLPTGSVSGTVTFPAGAAKGALVALFPDLFEGAPQSGAVVDPSTGAYTISYVEPGTYFSVTIKDVSGDGEPDMFNQGDPMGIYDPNSDTIPDSIFVAEGQHISAINMELRFPETTTARQNLGIAGTFVTSLFPDAFLAALGAQGFQTDGSAILWMYFYMSPSQQKGISFVSTSVISLWGVEQGLPPDAVALPDGWVDSDVAADTANVHGGLDFLTSHSEVETIAQLSWIDLGKTRALRKNAPTRSKKIFGQKLTFPGQNSIGAEARAAWLIDYWDQGTGDDLVILIDALSGELITPDTTLSEITARFRLPDADQEAKNWAADAVLTHVGPGSPLPPDGKSSIWAYSYYSSSQSTSRIFYAGVAGPISGEDLSARLPSNEALPENWIDSDVATAAAEANGGSAYRSRNPNAIMVGNVSKNMLEYYGRPSPAVWRFGYGSDTETTIFIFIDAVTGTHLSTKTDVATDARYNLEAADFCAQGFAADAKLTYVMNNTGSLDEQGRSSDSWLFSYYSANESKFASFQIIAGQVVFVYPFDSSPFGSTDPLPDNWMNSSQAVSIADANGGSSNRGEGVTVQGFLTKNFLGDNYDVSASTAVWFIQYLGSDFSIMVNAVTGEVILPTAVTFKNKQKIIPEDYSLSQNYPNPFNPETTIEYGLPRASHVKITIFNVQGEKIATLIQNFQQPGYHKIRWDGRNENGKPVASGIYLFQLKANHFSTVKKMLLLR